MSGTKKQFSAWLVPLLCLTLLILISGCNLSGSPEQQESIQTETPATTLLPSRTPASTSGLPATAQFPTLLPTTSFATQVVVIPTSRPPATFPPATTLPLNISILSPIPGNIVAGNVQVLGSAIHPQFLQYQLEFGPDPNPGNLWLQATSPVIAPVLNGLLGIWNTTTIPDGRYQLRLRVYLRDGRIEQTVNSNITVQNRINTPIPSPTQAIPRPIAAFTQDVTTGIAPLTVRFTNQSTGSINNISWHFGDGSSATDVNPIHVYNSPGLYTVTLTVTGPGGSSNVSRQIGVNSPSAPVAGFNSDRTGGIAPLTVQFNDQSTGNVTGYLWNFSDGAVSTDRNPQHVFAVPGTYNVILTVTGPGGSSSVIRQISVTSAIPPTSTSIPPTATSLPPTATFTGVPPTATWTFTPTNTFTGIPPTFTWTFTPTQTFTGVQPTFTETPLHPTATLTETHLPPTATWTETPLPTFTATFIPPTNTETPIPTATWTETPIPTATFTETPVPTATFTETPLPTNTETPVPTATFTETPIPPTPTFTETPVPDLAASFSFTVDPSNPLAVQFISQVTGGVEPYSYFWDFGDGASASDANPAHVYPGANTYNVTLMVSDANGRSTATNQQVTVTQPINAQFVAEAVNNAVQAIQFTDQTTGGVAPYSFMWDFGDGTPASNEQNPQHQYAAPGFYTVRLSVIDSQGASDDFNLDIEVIGAPATETPLPNIVDTTPIYPSFNDPRIGQTYQNGASLGNHASVFAVAGGLPLAQHEILRPFASGNPYNLGSNGDLQTIIDWFNQPDPTGTNSFTRASAAAGSDWTVLDLLDTSRANPSTCTSGETPFDCELRLSQPVMVVISVGWNDIQRGVDVATFEATLRTLVDTAHARGVIPVLLTVPAISGADAATVLSFNEAVIRVADENGALLLNIARLLNAVPQAGNNGFSLTVAPSGAGDLSDDSLAGFGANAVNAALLRTLSDTKANVFPSAAP